MNTKNETKNMSPKQQLNSFLETSPLIYFDGQIARGKLSDEECKKDAPIKYISSYYSDCAGDDGRRLIRYEYVTISHPLKISKKLFNILLKAGRKRIEEEAKNHHYILKPANVKDIINYDFITALRAVDTLKNSYLLERMIADHQNDTVLQNTIHLYNLIKACKR